eukprot:evm.model.scf_931.6 EVM.evm.TU.scf_931.6   scf_931:45254-50483(-)
MPRHDRSRSPSDRGRRGFGSGHLDRPPADHRSHGRDRDHRDEHQRGRYEDERTDAGGRPFGQARRDRDGGWEGERKRDRGGGPREQGVEAGGEEDGAERKRRRLEKLQQWKSSQKIGGNAAEEPKKQSPTCKAAWTPWDDPSAALNPGLPPVQPSKLEVPESIVRKRAEAAIKEAEMMRMANQADAPGEVDPLDAFMASEVMPEVKVKEKEEQKKVEEERLERLKQHVDGKKAKLPKVLEDSDSEEEADLEIQVPVHKVKLVIGPNGQKIQEIQRKSRCRLQVKKDAAELNRAFGSGPDIKIPSKDDNPKMTTIMIFGDSRGVEVAKRMIEEAVENKEQKQKQRHKEYERKRDNKRRERQLYHLRHTRDYEALGVPIGSSKADVKRAYKKLAVRWHPDKHPDDVEGAKAKFQEIQRAYQSLMTTDEDEKVEQIGAK